MNRCSRIECDASFTPDGVVAVMSRPLSAYTLGPVAGAPFALSLVMMLARACRLVFVLAVYLVCSGHNGGCHPDDGEPLPSPVHALGVVVERPDGSLDARLTLLSNAVFPHDFVAAVAPRLHTPSGDVLPLVAIAPGRYQLVPEHANELAYDTGNYLFAFSVEAQQARTKHVLPGDFVIAMHGTAEPPAVQLSDDGGESAEPQLTIRWQPQDTPALIELYDIDGALRFSNLTPDPEEAALPDWSALRPGGEAALPVAELVSAQAHALHVCAVEVARLGPSAPAASAQHLSGSASGWIGSSSGMLVGRCAEARVAGLQ